MTENMMRLYLDIIASLGTIPNQYKHYLFGSGKEAPVCAALIASYLAFEYIKYSFDATSAEYPLRHFFVEKTDDEKMLQSRILHYVLKYKESEIRDLGIKLPKSHKFSHVEMDTIEKRLAGYRITEMNFFEHQNIHDLELIKAIVERRIISAKKIPNQTFVSIFEQYDNFASSLKDRSKKSDQDMIFASIALFTFEWRYPVELLYKLAIFMEEQGISSINERDLVLLTGHITVESILGINCTGDSRMVKERAFCFLNLFDESLEDEEREGMRSWIKELFALCVQYKEIKTSAQDAFYKDWFLKESSPADWASFLAQYDVFSVCEKKRWTNKRIKNMRYLLNILFPKKPSAKNPEKRS